MMDGTINGVLEIPVIAHLNNNCKINAQFNKTNNINGFFNANNKIVGVINNNNNLNGKIKNNNVINSALKTNTNANYKSTLSNSNNLPNYMDEYDITPTATSSKILNTKNKILKNDIIIEKIPYHETSNEYGYTIYIG